jgi:hypothetical protein
MPAQQLTQSGRLIQADLPEQQPGHLRHQLRVALVDVRQFLGLGQRQVEVLARHELTRVIPVLTNQGLLIEGDSEDLLGHLTNRGQTMPIRALPTSPRSPPGRSSPMDAPAC